MQAQFGLGRLTSTYQLYSQHLWKKNILRNINITKIKVNQKLMLMADTK